MQGTCDQGSEVTSDREGHTAVSRPMDPARILRGCCGFSLAACTCIERMGQVFAVRKMADLIRGHRHSFAASEKVVLRMCSGPGW